jgi:hypothetical protein
VSSFWKVPARHIRPIAQKLKSWDEVKMCFLTSSEGFTERTYIHTYMHTDRLRFKYICIR